MSPPSTAEYDALMQRGQTLHMSGSPEQALGLFEQALALRPDSADAASACAAVLSDLQRPQAAYNVLNTHRSAVMCDADGACNLAIMAEACGHHDDARAAYDAALQFDPNHLRSLNNRALQARADGDWPLACDLILRAVAVLPDDAALRLNASDLLTGARRYPEAMQHILHALARHPYEPALVLRRVALLAYQAQFEEAAKAMAAMDGGARALLRQYLLGSTAMGRGSMHGDATRLPAAPELFAYQAFDAMQDCDWRHEATLVEVVRQTLADAEARAVPESRDLRDMQFYAMMLPLAEDEQFRLWHVLGMTIRHLFATKVAPWKAPAVIAQRGDVPLRVGVMAQSLGDVRYRNALANQLAQHDRGRFALTVYSPTPQPKPEHADELRERGANVVEIGQLSDTETAQRIRLDRLDLLLDQSIYTPLCRVEPVAMRVAAVQAYSCSWQRFHTTSLFDYSMGDPFTHPVGDARDFGALARLPHTCWLPVNDDLPAAAASRADAGLPADALVLCSFVASVMVDQHSFALWMQILKQLRHAVLWLPAYGRVAQANLRDHAVAAGVPADRLVFGQRIGRPELLARMACADLFVDTLRYNSNHGLADALRMGVPAVTRAGQSMASRLGGSIVGAAGLPDCVVESDAAYVDRIVHLGRNPAELAALRARLATAKASAPLFDMAARVREWESAWVTMIERQRAGLPPATFDVASAS